MALYTGVLKVPSGIKFTLNTLISESSPQFNLKYTTVGGPATNVSWTRDINPSLLLGSTVLVNATTAEYIHTLRVTGREVGNYTSNVMNNKPSSATVHLGVKGKS